MIDFEISARAALAVRALALRGFKGHALLSDPATGHLVLIRLTSTDCACVARAQITTSDEDHSLIEMPQLIVDPTWTPDVALHAASAELDRLNGQLCRRLGRTLN